MRNDPHGPEAFGGRLGLTVIELIIAGAILVVVLGLGSIFLSQQSQVQRVVQARNDVQDRARVAIQIITQDLSLAGNSGFVRADGTYVQPSGSSPCPNDLCLELNAFGDAVIRVHYVTGQVIATGTSQCRQVAYRVDQGALLRADVACNATLDPDDYEVLAEGTTGVAVELICSTGSRITTYPPIDACDVMENGSTVRGYPRTAIVTYGGENPVGRGGRPIEFTMTQEVLMPNLKDR